MYRYSNAVAPDWNLKFSSSKVNVRVLPMQSHQIGI